MHLANFHQDSWELYFGEAFGWRSMPPLSVRQSLHPGDAVKLIFHMAADEEDRNSGIFDKIEMMWVTIAEKHGEIYIGRLVNQLNYVRSGFDCYLCAGAEVSFLAEHVIDVQYPPAGYEDEEPRHYTCD